MGVDLCQTVQNIYCILYKHSRSVYLFLTLNFQINKPSLQVLK